MKYLLLLIPFLISCGNHKKEDATTNPETLIVEETKSIGEVELSNEESTFLEPLKGRYYSLQKKDNAYVYVEDCAYSEADLVITKKLDDVNFWELLVYSTSYDIQKVIQSNNTITITADGKTFAFTKKDTIWKLQTSQWEHITAFTKIKNIKEFPHDPCTSIHKIMDGIPENWYEVSEIDGKSVIFEPCEGATGGLTITGETIDFWSGSDPFPIISMTKSFNRVLITYTNGLQETDSIVMHDLDQALFRFGKGNKKDTRYVPDVIASDFPTLKEDCN